MGFERTAAGTKLISGITGAASAADGGLDPTDLTAVNGEIWFFGKDSSGKVGLWETSGTASSTNEIVTGVSGSEMTAYDGGVVFAGAGGGMWVSNGTQSGTFEIPASEALEPLGELDEETKLFVPPGGLKPTGFDPYSDDLVFTADYAFTESVVTHHNTQPGLFVWNGSSLSLFDPDDGPYDQQNGGGAFSTETPNAPIVNIRGANFTPALFQGDDGDLYEIAGECRLVSEAASSPTVAPQGYKGPLDPNDLTAIDGYLVFNGAGAGAKQDLYIYGDDGALDLASVIGAADKSGKGLDPTDLTVFDGEVYFNGHDKAGDRTLFELALPNANVYKSSGSPAGYTGSAYGLEATGIAGAASTGLNPTDITAVTVSSGVAPDAVTEAELVEDVALNEISPGLGNAPSGYGYLLLDTSFDIESIADEDLAGVVSAGLKAIESTTGSLIFNADEVAAFAGVVDVAVPDGDTVKLVDTAADIESLSASTLAELNDLSIRTLVVADAQLKLTVAQVEALENKVTIVPAKGHIAEIKDAAAKIVGMSASQIAALTNEGVTLALSSDVGMTMDLAKADDFLAAHVVLGAPSGDVTTVADTASALEALTTSTIIALGADGVNDLASTTGAVNLSPSQLAAIAAAHMEVSASASPTPKLNFIGHALSV